MTPSDLTLGQISAAEEAGDRQHGARRHWQEGRPAPWLRSDAPNRVCLRDPDQVAAMGARRLEGFGESVSDRLLQVAER
jgi:hypothetical protein